jgi:phosphate transport system substrate-binding protein
MRKLIIAAATAASLGTLGLAATAQAQTASHAVHPVAATVKGTDVAGIAQSEIVTLATKATTACKSVKTTGLPNTVTAGTSSKVNKGCTVEIEGVWPATPATRSLKITWTQGGTAHTETVNKTILPMPCENDAVGVGSDTLTPLVDQLASDYNNSIGGVSTPCSQHSTTTPFEESWDAVNPVSGAIGDSIPVKADCSPIARPDGSSAGINQLKLFTKSTSGPFCENFARSSRARNSGDPALGPGGVAFVALAGDAVTWSHPAVNTSAPASLTPAQLNAIYTCTDTNWSQVGGGNQNIKPFLPQSGSGTLSTFLLAIGVTTPGSCVSTGSPANTLEENEGVNPVLNDPGAIFIYSAGDWIAQQFHAPKCAKAGCTASNGVICKKTPNLDQFWCNVSGTGTAQGAEVLGQVNGVAPTTGSGTSTVINPAFFAGANALFGRTLFQVVPFNTTASPIPSGTNPVGGVDLDGIFGASGFDCTSAVAKADITNYGFLNIGNCGGVS